MKPIFTFTFTVITKPSYRLKIELGRKHGRWPIVNPWIEELEWANEMTGVDHPLCATLWGSDSPWRADEALAAIAEASGGLAQDPQLEAAVPEAISELRRVWHLPSFVNTAGGRVRQAEPMRVIFPGLSASWNRHADTSVERDTYRRRNSLGRRLAMAIHSEFDAETEKFSLAVARLFPCTCSGDEYPHEPDRLLLQIHR